MDTWDFWQRSQNNGGKKKKASSINVAGQTGCLQVEECKYIQIYHPAQNSSPSGSKTSR